MTSSRPSNTALTGTRLVARIRNLGLAAICVAALSACGGSEPADFTDGTAAPSVSATETEVQETQDPTVDLLAVESGFMTEDFGEGLTVAETVRPEKGAVVTPVGTLTLKQVQAVETLTPEQIGLTSQTDDGAEVLAYGPADGEVFRVLELAFVPLQGKDRADASADLSITVGGAQKHLRELDDEQTLRLLVSMPDDGSTQLVVSSEGHDQFLDVLTGERQDDDVAAAYYRGNTLQEPHHTIRVESATFTTDSSSGAEDDVVTDFSFDVESATITAWTKDGGWAEPGTAWLGVTWAYDLGTAEDGLLVRFTSLNVAAAIDVAGEVTTDEFHEERFFGTTGTDGERTAWAAVPADMTTATIGFSGDYAMEIPNGQGVKITSEPTGTFASETYEITFPAEG